MPVFGSWKGMAQLSGLLLEASLIQKYGKSAKP